jgi:DNA-3-methyladenine glycosylase
MNEILTSSFFDRDAQALAKDLIGKVIRVKYARIWLSAMIIETEAYYLKEKGSHASLGYTEKRKALFMPAGTIYMYHARGGDSLNISARGGGNAVLIKSGVPFQDAQTGKKMLEVMQSLNPQKNSNQPRDPQKLCSGQTLLCKSLGLKVREWDQKNFDVQRFYFADVGYTPEQIIQTTRLGIPKGRDEHLLYRFIDYTKAQYCTKNPLSKREAKLNVDYVLLKLKS